MLKDIRELPIGTMINEHFPQCGDDAESDELFLYLGITKDNCAILYFVNEGIFGKLSIASCNYSLEKHTVTGREWIIV